MEARSDEAGQTHPVGRAQMPTIAECRQALGVHGRRDNFRTITIQFDSPGAAAWFDAVASVQGVNYAVSFFRQITAEAEVVE
jgi:hypothetical protein